MRNKNKNNKICKFIATASETFILKKCYVQDRRKLAYRLFTVDRCDTGHPISISGVYRVDEVHDSIFGVSVTGYHAGFFDKHFVVHFSPEAERITVNGFHLTGERPRRSALAAHRICGHKTPQTNWSIKAEKPGDLATYPSLR